MTKKEIWVCNGIIHASSVLGAATGLIETKHSDSVILSSVQLGMISALGRVFNIDLTKCELEASIASALACKVGKNTAEIARGITRNYGNSITGAVITEFVGWMIVKNFEKERTMIENEG